MELYEVLYTVPASEIEETDLIRFDYLDEDNEVYTEVVNVIDVDYIGDHVELFGFSQTLNIKTQFTIHEDEAVEVLGG